jgi:hypothetical protein
MPADCSYQMYSQTFALAVPHDDDELRFDLTDERVLDLGHDDWLPCPSAVSEPWLDGTRRSLAYDDFDLTFRCFRQRHQKALCRHQLIRLVLGTPPQVIAARRIVGQMVLGSRQEVSQVPEKVGLDPVISTTMMGQMRGAQGMVIASVTWLEEEAVVVND